MAPKPLVLQRFAGVHFDSCLGRRQQTKGNEKRVSGKGGQKNAQNASKRAILPKGEFRDFSVVATIPGKTVTPFRTIKQAVSEDPDRLLTLPGPLINPWNAKIRTAY